jgi:hypothetical protein
VRPKRCRTLLQFVARDGDASGIFADQRSRNVTLENPGEIFNPRDDFWALPVNLVDNI